jgi:hypothetical protein
MSGWQLCLLIAILLSEVKFVAQLVTLRDRTLLCLGGRNGSLLLKKGCNGSCFGLVWVLLLFCHENSVFFSAS